MSHEYIYIQVLSIPRPIQSGFSSIYNLPKDSSYREIRFYVIYAHNIVKYILLTKTYIDTYGTCIEEFSIRLALMPFKSHFLYIYIAYQVCEFGSTSVCW